MRIFMIEAYGGPVQVDGSIHHFAVQAETAEEAVELVQGSDSGQRFARFDVVDVGEEIEAEEAQIIDETEGAYPKPARQ